MLEKHNFQSGADDFEEVVLGNVVADLPVYVRNLRNGTERSQQKLCTHIPNGRICSDIFDHLSVDAIVTKEPDIDLGVSEEVLDAPCIKRDPILSD